MWTTIGLAALGVLGLIVAMFFFVTAGSPGSAVGILVVGLLYLGGVAYSAWKGGQGHNWGRIVITVLFGLGILGNLVDFTAASLVGLVLWGGLITLWWVPPTTQAMRVRAQQSTASGY
jgi:hypothetical protein